MTEYIHGIKELLTFFKRGRMFHYMQLGVSSRCFLDCVVCPHTCFLGLWNSMDMTIETYRQIYKGFPHVENVYLSGWGEPLLNPYVFDMIQIAKTAGCSVGFTTNGALLDDTIRRKIIDLETDLVSISIAGARAETHETLRVGSSFEQLTSNIRSMAKQKENSRSDVPKILLLFMMTNKNLDELPLSVDLAAEVRADGVVATNLDYVANTLHDKLRAFTCSEADQNFVKLVRRAQTKAKNKGILFHAFPLEMEPVPVCSEDPLNSLYISEDGGVSPCVYLALPIQEISRIFCGKETIIPRINFGNINEQNLFDIWNSSEYTLFREEYEQRVKGATYEPVEHLPKVCRTCYKAYGI